MANNIELKPILTRDEYMALPNDETKAKYRVFVPESDPEVKAEIDLAEAEIKAAAKFKPLHDKIMGMPVDLPGKQFVQAIETLETMISLLDPIKALMNVPIIGTLVKPLVNFLNTLISVIGSIFYILGCLALAKEVFTDSICKVINDINWDELADAKKSIELKKKAVEKAKAEKQKQWEAESEEDRKAEEDRRKKEVAKRKAAIKAATKAEIEKAKAEVSAQTKKLYENFELADSYAKIMKAMEVSLEPYSWKHGTIKQVFVKVIGSLGIDLSPLDQMTPEQEKAFMKKFPDPKENIDEMNKLISKMNKNTMYALIPEVEEETKEKK